MKKYTLLLALVASMCATKLLAADFGDLLERLNSRDFSAERDVVTGRGSVYVGELVNPHSETPMFKARDEFRAKIAEAQKAEDETAINDLCQFIADAMKTDVSDETKVWLLEQLGVIGTDKDVPVAAELLKSGSRRLVDGAAACLAQIPGDTATKALEDNADVPAAAAALIYRNTPVISYDGVENVAPLKLSHATDDEVDEWLKKYDDMDEWAQEITLASLVARNNKKYRPYALKALASDSEGLRRAGFLALEKLATAEDVDVFVQNLAVDSALTIRIASFVVADGFDDALLETLDQTTDVREYTDLVTILSNRAVDVRARIFSKTASPDCPDRLALLRKAREISTTDDVPYFVQALVVTPRGKERDDIEKLIASLCNKDAQPILNLFGQVPAQYNDLLLSLVARTGGDAAKNAIDKLINSSNEVERAAGLRALNVWSDGQFADKMEELLASDKLTDAQWIALQRAYIRTISLPDDEIGIDLSRDSKLEKLRKAFDSAKRSDEKALVLSRLAANRTAKSMAFAIECANDQDEKVVVAAHSAIADHVHDTILRKENPELAARGIEIILNNSKDEGLIERVKIYKERMEQ
ncbi:MAG: hypothetical protein ACOX0A_03430 [Thermoguttaceae bacterium]|jgi:hypothetical protein